MYVFRMAPGKTPRESSRENSPGNAKTVPIRPKVYIYIILQLPAPGVKWKPGNGKRKTIISPPKGGKRSMVEQSHAGERHDHVVFVTAADHLVVTYGAARLRNIVNAASSCALYVV